MCCVCHSCFIVAGKLSKEIKTEEDSEVLEGCHETSEAAVGKSQGAAIDGITTCSEAQQESDDMSINLDQPISRKRVKLASEVIYRIINFVLLSHDIILLPQQYVILLLL